MFNVCVRRDVFKYMFSNRGSSVCRRPGKFYTRSDFSNDFFSDNDFMFTNKFDEVVRVVFPIYSYSYVKFVKLSCTNRTDYYEYVSVKLIKELC